jgi:hypothetical protein
MLQRHLCTEHLQAPPRTCMWACWLAGLKWVQYTTQLINGFSFQQKVGGLSKVAPLTAHRLTVEPAKGGPTETIETDVVLVSTGM